MVKAINNVIKNPAVKSLALAGMLTLSALSLNSCGNNTNSNAVGQNQTEVVSKAGAKTLKNNLVENSLYSDGIYNELYEGVLFFTRGYKPEVIETIEKTMQNYYDKHGTFLGSFETQTFFDNIAILYIQKILESSTPAIKDLESKYVENRLEARKSVQSFSEVKPSAQEVLKRLDEFYYSLEFVTDKEKNQYEKNLKNFKKENNTGNIVNDYSSLIAYKTHLIDKAILANTIDGLNASPKLSGEKIDKERVLSSFSNYAEILP